LLNNIFREKVKIIEFSGPSLNDDNIFKLCKIITTKKIDYIEEIKLSFNKTTSKGFSIFVDSLLDSKNENIFEIHIYGKGLDDDCIEKLGELIKKNKNIKNIIVNNNNMTNKGVEILSEYIVGNTSIVSINLSHNLGITNKSCEIIKHMIRSSTISSFKIRGTEINKESKLEIEELLKIPIDQREIPLITIGNVKSASKRMKE